MFCIEIFFLDVGYMNCILPDYLLKTLLNKTLCRWPDQQEQLEFSVLFKSIKEGTGDQTTNPSINGCYALTWSNSFLNVSV